MCRSSTILTLLFLTFAVSARTIVNPGFENPSEDDASEPSAWRTGMPGYEVALDSHVAHEGRASVRIEKTGAGQFGVATQTIDPGEIQGDRINISAYARTRRVTDGRAVIWVRVDGEDGILFNDYMEGGGLSGDTDWTRLELQAPVFPDTTAVMIGGSLFGSGTAWFDSFVVEAVVSEGFSSPSPAARTYLEEALDLMERRALAADSVDWNTLRTTVMKHARGAELPSDTHKAIQYAVGRLGDRHSDFLPPIADDRESGQHPGKEARSGNMQAMMLEAGIAYLPVNRFHSTGDKAKASHAQALHGAIAEQAAQGACGWLVDLRANSGGNMWPMIAGIGPLLGEGNLGRFVGRKGEAVDWWYRNGKAGAGERINARADGEIPGVGPTAPVAMLVGPGTASSGEAVAIAFQGRPNTKLIGQRTAGRATANNVFRLPDGARLVLTTAEFRDRTGKRYPGGIEPDLLVKGEAASAKPNSDPVIRAASAWLDGHPACDGHSENREQAHSDARGR